MCRIPTYFVFSSSQLPDCFSGPSLLKTRHFGAIGDQSGARPWAVRFACREGRRTHDTPTGRYNSGTVHALVEASHLQCHNAAKILQLGQQPGISLRSCCRRCHIPFFLFIPFLHRWFALLVFYLMRYALQRFTIMGRFPGVFPPASATTTEQRVSSF